MGKFPIRQLADNFQFPMVVWALARASGTIVAFAICFLWPVNAAAQSFDEVEGLASDEGMVVADTTTEPPAAPATAPEATTAETTSTGPELWPWLLGAAAAGGLIIAGRRRRRVWL